VGGDLGTETAKAAAQREKKLETSAQSNRLKARKECDTVQAILDDPRLFPDEKMEKLSDFILNQSACGQISKHVHERRIERAAQAEATMRLERDKEKHQKDDAKRRQGLSIAFSPHQRWTNKRRLDEEIQQKQTMVKEQLEESDRSLQGLYKTMTETDEAIVDHGARLVACRRPEEDGS